MSAGKGEPEKERERAREPEEKSKWERELARRIKCRRLNGRIVRKVRDSPSSRRAARDILASPPPPSTSPFSKEVEGKQGRREREAATAAKRNYAREKRNFDGLHRSFAYLLFRAYSAGFLGPGRVYVWQCTSRIRVFAQSRIKMFAGPRGRIGHNIICLFLYFESICNEVGTNHALSFFCFR